MGVTPIPIILRAERTMPSEEVRQVEPTLGVAFIARMEDDSYGGNREAADRGLEGEDEQPEGELAEEELPVSSSRGAKRIDFFA